MSSILKVDGVGYAFGPRRVLEGVSFTVTPGRVTLLLGPNGAGKTTLFSLIAGLLAPKQGKIALPGEGRAGLSIVFQQPALDLDLTVTQNLSYHAGLYGLSHVTVQERLSPLLEGLDLNQRLKEKVRALNGGHRRRVEIVRALMTNPSLLLLDEPTAGLDAPTRASLVAFLHAMARERNIALLWATHLTDEAESADDVIVLHEGRVVAAGLLKNVLRAANTASLDQAFATLTRIQAA